MKLSTFAIIVALLAVIFGLSFIIIPVQVGTFYGLTSNTAGILVSRYWGATLIFTGHTAVFHPLQNPGPNCSFLVSYIM